MPSAKLYAPGDMRIEEQAIPQAGTNEIVVKVESSGLCPTDVKIFKFGSSSVSYPVVLGHEFSGVVTEAGKGVTGIQVGDRVNVAADAFCGECQMCMAGHENLCERPLSFGYNVNGAHADYVLVPERFVLKGGVFRLPPNMGYTDASFTEPTACSLHDLNIMEAVNKRSIAIIGDGPMGLMHVALAAHLKIPKIILIGLSDWKLKIGRELGATNTLDARAEQSSQAVKQLIPAGVDCVAVTTVIPDTVRESVQMVAKTGIVSIFAGVPKEMVPLPVDTNVFHYKEAILTGSSGYTYAEYRKAFDMISTGNLKLDKMISDSFPLERIMDAIARWQDKDRSLKVMITHGAR